jgi:hypothetical protein
MKKYLTFVILLLIFTSSCFRNNQEGNKSNLQKEVWNIAIGGISDLSWNTTTSELKQNF